MNKIESLFLKLFHDFVRQENTVYNLELNEEQWIELFHLSELHHVLPIIYESAMKRDVSVRQMPAEMLNRWKNATKTMVITQIRMTLLFLSLYKEMEEEGIKALVVKGLICRNLYCQPDYRISGDEDLLIQKEDFWRMDDFLIKRGFSRKEE